MKVFILSIIIIALVNISYSQEYKYGKVSKVELMEKFNPKDSSASATILYKKHRVYYLYNKEKGFEVVTEIVQKVKIYNQGGFDYATSEISLYKGDSEEEKVTGLKGVTYNIENGEIIESKLGKGGIFKEELSKYRNQTKFTMPNIKEGSVIEFKYDIRSPFSHNIDEIPFQYKIPVKRIEVVVEIPEYYGFNPRTKGYLPFSPKTSKKKGSITFNNKQRSGGGGFNTTKTSFSTTKVDYITNISTINLNDVPALKDEKYVNSINNYRASIKYELAHTKFPNSYFESYTNSWDDVVDKIYKYDDFGGELAKTNYFKSDIDALINGVSSNTERIALIFNYVKSKMNWNNYTGYTCSDGVRKAYKDNVGNVAEINLMLTSMLRYAGLDANPTLVSTRSHGIPLFPTREGFNYVVCAVNIEGGNILLDATNKYAYPNILPERALNWFGRIIKKDGSSLQIDLMPVKKSKEMATIFYSLSDDGTANGKIRNQFSDQNALRFRGNYTGVDEDDYLEKMENKYGGIEISDYEVKNMKDLSKLVTESYSFSFENAFEAIGDKLYMSPLLFLTEDENPFKSEKREYPVDYSYPRFSKYMVNIQIPEGYQVETIPEAMAMGLPDNLGVFKYNISSKGNSIQVIINQEINSAIIPPRYYIALKEYYSKLVQKETEKIVLSKI